jgi:Flp pilus assembly protein TadD
MRIIVVLTAVTLAACAAPRSQELADRPPGLAVARAALAGDAPALALQVCSDTVRREPDNMEAQVCEGDALLALGRPAEAEASFARALQLLPDATDALMGMGRVRLGTEAVAAESLFRRVLDQEPRNASAWNDLGIALDLQDRHEQAQEAYGRALGAAPDMRAAEVNLALSLAMSGHADAALSRLRAIAGDPQAPPRLRHDLAAVLTMAGQPEEAARLLRRELRPDEIDQAIAGYRALPATPAR